MSYRPDSPGGFGDHGFGPEEPERAIDVVDVVVDEHAAVFGRYRGGGRFGSGGERGVPIVLLVRIFEWAVR